ncbi:MAG: hypothetical protein LC104_18435 [Bacteroidales bacterium]|nr:hypothetical protein [Bacteroidales bacterium]
MNAPVRQLLDLFDALPEPDKRSAATEIIRRMPGDGELTADDHDALTDELFAALDAEEANRDAVR